jgi:glycosyltransferase involved in cell wall biosynthesis
MRFASAVGQSFDRFVLIARATGDAEATPYELPGDIELAELPFYPSLRAIGKVLARMPATIGAMWRALAGVDVIWVSGVHPFGLLLIALAAMRRKRIVLLIRQDSPRYFRSRLPSRAWAPLLVPLGLLDLAFRLVGRTARTTAVGPEIAERYGAPRPNVLEMRVTLLDRNQLAPGPRPDPSGQVELLTVGRIAPEKTPLTAVEALAELERREPGRHRLTWVGEGPLADEMRGAAEAAGVADRLRLPGFVPFGPELLAFYRDSDVLVHTAMTEGVPGVLYEAMGSGLAVVATDVGGVPEALEEGAAGLLVPPGDPVAIADAVQRLEGDPALRRSLAGHGMELARRATIESEGARVAAFISGEPAA